MEQPPNPQRKYNWKIISGTILMILSTLVFFGMGAIPFLHFDAKTKIKITTVMFISMEVLWWVGVLIIGKEIYSRYKHLLNPVNWFRKRRDQPDQSQEN